MRALPLCSLLVMRCAAFVGLGRVRRDGLRSRPAASTNGELGSDSPPLRRSDAGQPFEEAELAAFDQWLEGQRSEAADGTENCPPERSQATIPGSSEIPSGGDSDLHVVDIHRIKHVLDAGAEVDTAFSFSGVAWQVLADLSTNAFGPGDIEVILHFPGMASTFGCEVFDVFAELFASARSEASSGLVELARLHVASAPLPGPALVLRARPRTPEETALALERRAASVAASQNEGGCTEAVRRFVGRVVVGDLVDTGASETKGATKGASEAKGACPYTESVDWAATSLSKQGVEPGPVAYRFEACSDALDAMAACWRGFAEVLNTAETDLSTTLLSLPAVAPPPPLDQAAPAVAEAAAASQARFLGFSDLVSRSLMLYGLDQLFGLVFFHPLYDRNAVAPKDDPSYGHIPPLSWLPSMLRRTGSSEEQIEWLAGSEENLGCSNFQRRAPLLVVNILRGSQLVAATGGLSVVEIEVPAASASSASDAATWGATRKVEASGLRTYSRNAIKLASQGELELLLELADEMNLAYPAA